MAERLFLFVQMEFPWELGPPDGRYLLRAHATGEPERVVVLNTVGAGRRGREPFGARARRPQVTSEPAPVPTARATVIDPVSVAAERQARTWLVELDAERETRAAAATLNRMLSAHRIATADPHLHELSPAQALVVRAGWGEGEQVAYGHWLHARELRWREPRARRRKGGLRPQEHLAALLAAREQALVCEELTLRARLDLDAGRLALAVLELEAAYAAALTELPRERRPELVARIAELAELQPGVLQAAREALPREAPTAERPPDPAASAGAGALDDAAVADEPTIRHALVRLEAALRARTAAGFDTR